MAEVRAEQGWHEHVRAFGRDWLDNKIGAGILADMKAGCPVDTHKLVDSLDKEIVDDYTLRVGSTDVEYSTYVNEGHRIVYRDRNTGEKVDTGRIQPPQDFMRPALFRERSV